MAGIIVRSVSLWASPIAIVGKISEAGESLSKRLCVDYIPLNKLPPATKAH